MEKKEYQIIESPTNGTETFALTEKLTFEDAYFTFMYLYTKTVGKYRKPVYDTKEAIERDKDRKDGMKAYGKFVYKDYTYKIEKIQ